MRPQRIHPALWMLWAVFAVGFPWVQGAEEPPPAPAPAPAPTPAPIPVPVPDSGEAAKPAAPVPPLRIVSLSPRCYAMVQADGRSNAGFVVGKDAVAVIDCLGSGAKAKELLAEVRKVTDKPVKYLVYTHWHFDHTVGSHVFPKETRVLATEAAIKLIGETAKAMGAAEPDAMKSHGNVGVKEVRVPDAFVPGKLDLDLGEVVVQLFEAGACHSAGDLVAWVPGESVLYAGDLVSNGHHPKASEGKSFLWISALAQLERFKPAKVLPGHGEPGDGKILDDQQQYFMEIRRAVKHLLGRKVPLADILTKFTVPEVWKSYGHAPFWSDNVAHIVQEIADGN